MGYFLVIYLVSSIASRLCDKYDRSMTLGKLLDNNPTLFIFISEVNLRIFVLYKKFISQTVDYFLIQFHTPLQHAQYVMYNVIHVMKKYIQIMNILSVNVYICYTYRYMNFFIYNT